jgi:ABC-type lipoprotein release transport system permease subunit
VKFILSMAFKNLSRYKRRTAITAVAIAIGLMTYLLVDSLFLGIKQESIRNLTWYETASARIHADGYWEERQQLPLDRSIPDPDSLVSLLADNGFAATARTRFSADMILYATDFGEDGNLPVLVTAIDPETDNDVFHFSDTLAGGRFLRPGEEEGILLGSWFAEDIGAQVGYWVTLVTRGNGGFYETMDMQVVGIVNCPNPNVNRSLVLMDRQAASDYLALDGDATEVDVRLADDSLLPDLSDLVSSLGQGLQTHGWKDLAKDYLAMADAKRGGSSTILFLVFLIAAVGISNTMLMAIQERTRELGTMRALGLDDRQIHLLFLFEAGGIGLIGSLFGILLGCLGNIYLVNVGIDFGWLMRDFDIGYRIQGIMRGAWSLESILVAFFSGTVLSMFFAWFPVRKALRNDIPSCLAHR